MTIYSSVKDFRVSMHDKFGADRAHAVCRKLLGTASQNSRMYGAVYWASCQVLKRPGVDSDYEIVFLREMSGCRFPRGVDTCDIKQVRKHSPRWAFVLWRWALRRVKSVKRDALKLESSILW